ncbi:MAG: YicC family protein [Alphaproteobacteria bacterium]|nr:YicC family protein [Alphaproteobacteria bacterium]
MTADVSPLQSMTGFAAVDGSRGEASWTWSLKSVNGKSLDVRWRMPGRMDGLEASLKKTLQAQVSRGSVSASLQLDLPGRRPEVTIDEAALDRLAQLVRRRDGAAPDTAALLGLPGVLETRSATLSDEEQGALNEAVLQSFGEAAAALRAARLGEGAQLHAILTGLVDQIEALVAQAEPETDAVAQAVAERLTALASDLATKAGTTLSEDRLAQEAAVLATKADVREELDRLRAHIESARGLLNAGEPVGRKLDFLAQEFMREANTLCSKAGSMSLTNTGLALKSVVDQFKEQVANVE